VATAEGRPKSAGISFRSIAGLDSKSEHSWQLLDLADPYSAVSVASVAREVDDDLRPTILFGESCDPPHSVGVVADHDAREVDRLTKLEDLELGRVVSEDMKLPPRPAALSNQVVGQLTPPPVGCVSSRSCIPRTRRESSSRSISAVIQLISAAGRSIDAWQESCRRWKKAWGPTRFLQRARPHMVGTHQRAQSWG